MSQQTACLGGQAHGGLDKLTVPAGHTAADEDRGVLQATAAVQAALSTGTPK